MIMVDYKCPACGTQYETLVRSPAPTTRACVGCGSDARRLFTTAGLVRRGGSPVRAAGTDCFENPDVPGLCHVGPAAKKALIARYRGDEETLKAEQTRQAVDFERHGPPSMNQVASHSHTAGSEHKASVATARKIAKITDAVARTLDK